MWQLFMFYSSIYYLVLMHFDEHCKEMQVKDEMSSSFIKFSNSSDFFSSIFQFLNICLFIAFVSFFMLK